MTEWREVRLVDVSAQVDYGYTASAADDPELPRFLRITDIVGTHIDWSSVPGCVVDGKQLKKCALQAGDIVVARTGATVGHAKRIRQHPESVFASYLVRFRPSSDVDPAYVGAIVESQQYKDFVLRNAGGAAQPNANAKVLGSFSFLLPDRKVQERVGRIVDTFDDLIQNNRRRIQLLEQMANAIYREWFVHFGYPGHEDRTLVDSSLGPIPEAWEVSTIGQVLELRYGKALKAADRKGGSVAVVGSSDVVGWHDEEIVSGPAIVVGRKGNVGNVTWVPGPCWPIDTTYYVHTDLPLRYVAEQLKRAEFINTHAAVPGLSRDQAYSLPFLLPPSDIMFTFSEISDSLGLEGQALSEQIKRLAVIRDLLLPKLVTGQIDVSSLDLDVEVESVA